MNEPLLVSGNIAAAMGAIAAGCRHYFGYPITPQNDIPEFFSRELPKLGGTFLQAESEIAAINMVLGASACGMRALTSSSGPGISLMQEGISYLAGSELPAVIINISRSGPGLGGIEASQADYFQAVRGGGHGGYRTIVVAPASIQEMYELTLLAFTLTDRYRMPAILLADAVIGQMKEVLRPATPAAPSPPAKDWAVSGKQGRTDQRIVKSLRLGQGEMEAFHWELERRFRTLQTSESRWEESGLDDAELVVTAYGSAARIARSAVETARAAGHRVGLLRPITLSPFPLEPYARVAARGGKLLCIELSTGQMLDDVRLATGGRAAVTFYGRPAGTGSLPTPEELLTQILKQLGVTP